MKYIPLLPSERLSVNESWRTPTGKRRRFPQYEIVVANAAIDATRAFRGASLPEVIHRAGEQLDAWRAKQDHLESKATAETMSAECAARIEVLESILTATLAVNDAIDWTSMRDNRPHPPFSWERPAPAPPLEAIRIEAGLRSLWARLFRPHRVKLEARLRTVQTDHARKTKIYDAERQAARDQYERHRVRHLEARDRHNAALDAFRQRFEARDPDAVVEYLEAVFERSSYPVGFTVVHEVGYDSEGRIAVVNVEVPPPSSLPALRGYKYVKSREEIDEVPLKTKETAALFDETVARTVLRTLHEIFESVYTDGVDAAVVNAWVTSTEPETGLEGRACVASVAVERCAFSALDLRRVAPSACLKGLGCVGGPDFSDLDAVAPLRSIPREGQAAPEKGADSSSTGGAGDWRDFEHLLEGLFQHVLAGPGAQLTILKSNAEEGVEAIARDADAEAGGVQLLRGRRSASALPASAVTDLQVAMKDHGASRGILVTTTSFARDARAMAHDRPITLIDGAALLKLVAESGHRMTPSEQAR